MIADGIARAHTMVAGNDERSRRAGLRFLAQIQRQRLDILQRLAELEGAEEDTGAGPTHQPTTPEEMAKWAHDHANAKPSHAPAPTPTSSQPDDQPLVHPPAPPGGQAPAGPSNAMKGTPSRAMRRSNEDLGYPPYNVQE